LKLALGARRDLVPLRLGPVLVLPLDDWDGRLALPGLPMEEVP
jgi:hypothetical protein